MAPNSVLSRSLAAALALTVGCAVEPAGTTHHALEDGTPEADGVLAMLNHRAMTRDVLDDDVGLDSRAATNLVAHRNGADGVLGTADDDRFDTIAEADAVPYVGASALDKLLAYATAHGWVDPGEDVVGVYDDVPFTAAEIAAVLALVADASLELLDDDVALDSRAAAAIVAARPILSMDQLSACSYVGRSAMQKLKSYAVAGDYGDPESEPPLSTTISALTADAESHGTGSQFFGRRVSLERAIVTAGPSATSGGLWFWIADPWQGATARLRVYVTADSGLDTGFLSIFDDVSLTGTFTAYGSSFELLLDAADLHAITLRRSGLPFTGYRTVQAAWHSTAANPEGVVRLISTTGYTYMVPLPIFLDHPMWNGNPPGPPEDSGNEQDLAWNQAAQAALDAWR